MVKVAFEKALKNEVNAERKRLQAEESTREKLTKAGGNGVHINEFKFFGLAAVLQ